MAVVAVDSARDYTEERSTGVFEAASARTVPHESREVECVRGEERTIPNQHWSHWLKAKTRRLFH